MKNLLFALMLVVLVGCGAPAPEGEESMATEEMATTEDVAGEMQEEALEALPEGSLPLPEILAKLEALGYTEIIETEFENGAWEVEYMVDGEERELRVDPLTGEILPEEPEETDEE